MRFRHLLQRLAEKSDSNYKIGALLVKGGSVLNVGFNHKGTSKLIEKRRHLRPINSTVHAEIHAILGIPKSVAAGAVIYTGRFTPSGKVSNSRPCTLCQSILKEMNIRKVFYTVSGEKRYSSINL